MIQRKLVLLIAVFMVVYFGVSPALSVPAARDFQMLEQKDDSTFMAILWGDEWSHGWETADGHSIILDETTQDWTYAIPGADENLVSSINVVGRDSPPPTISKHIRPAGKAQSKILNLDAEMASGLPERADPVTGTTNIPVILINFNNTSTTYTAINFTTLLFGSGTKSLKDYYEEVSYGTFSISPGPGGITGWYTASKNHDYYGQNNANGRDMWPGTLVREAVIAADPTVNFATYDKNEDCYVDVVNIIHQGSGEEISGTTNIWSHEWDLNSAYIFGRSDGGEYSTNDVCPAGGFIKVNNYVIQPETQNGGQVTIGVFAHEYGHALGLPDLYDTTYHSDGIGEWSVMASGLWNGIIKDGDTPAHLDAWSRSMLGWVSPTQVSTSSITAIKRVEDNNEVYQILNNPNGVTDWTRTGTGRGEYFLVENRQKTGFDAALPGEGLLIWHIDESMGGNTDKTHKLVDLEEADGLDHLDTYGLNRGDAFDPWYTNVVGFTATSTPNSHFYNGSDSGFRVTNIGVSGTIMEATLIVSGGSGPTVTSITPAIGENTGSVSITDLAGTNFVTGATVRLISSDNSNINATGVTVVSPTKITCTLPLSGKTAGQYNVFVINPDSQAGVLLSGFSVTEPSVPKVTSITPANGVNTSSVSITNLAGTDFAEGATVKLNRTGYADILGTSVTVVSSTQITCTFDLTNRIAGVYNVVVINPGNQALVLLNGFTVTEIPAPVASFTANVTAGTAPLTVQFTDTSTGSPDYWSWYSDRHGFNTNDPESRDWTHTYQNTGTYTVDLTVMNDAGSDTESKIGFIVVFSLNPLPGFSTPPTDPDGDGLYEDLNANGFADWDDAVVLFWNTDWIQDNEPRAAFDFNHNGFIDWDDAVVLFWEV